MDTMQEDPKKPKIVSLVPSEPVGGVSHNTGVAEGLRSLADMIEASPRKFKTTVVMSDLDTSWHIATLGNEMKETHLVGLLETIKFHIQTGLHLPGGSPDGAA